MYYVGLDIHKKIMPTDAARHRCFQEEKRPRRRNQNRCPAVGGLLFRRRFRLPVENYREWLRRHLLHRDRHKEPHSVNGRIRL